MSVLSYQEVMWAEMKPDLYDGPGCDQVKPAWSCFCDGDKDGEDGLELIELAANTFPPGTKIVVSLPECPECHEIVELCQSSEYCDFDWGCLARQ